MVAARRRARAILLAAALAVFTLYFLSASHDSSLILPSNVVYQTTAEEAELANAPSTAEQDLQDARPDGAFKVEAPKNGQDHAGQQAALAEKPEPPTTNTQQEYSLSDPSSDEHGANVEEADPSVVEQQPLNPQEVFQSEAQEIPWNFKLFESSLKRIKQPFWHRASSAVIDDPRTPQRPHPQKSKLFNPYPKYDSAEWKQEHRAEFQPCMGPRGKFLNESLDDRVSVYVGSSPDRPEPIFGSHEVLGLDAHVCYDRYSRYGAYGHGEEETTPARGFYKPEKVDWDIVDWGKLQRQCIVRNAGRFDPSASDIKAVLDAEKGMAVENTNFVSMINSTSKVTNPSAKHEPRTAILLRSYTGKVYTPNDMHNIRSMITELSLMSGGQYEVILLVHVLDSNIPIWEDDVYEKVLKENVPQEFWNIAELWNIYMVKEPYHNLDDGLANVHQSQWMPIQQFSIYRPEFDYLWNWEIDSRYTGHMYELLEKMSAFGRKQPRKGIWERSERFYVPEVHGNYDTDFRHFVETHTDQDTAVWGPVAVPEVTPLGPKPPVPHPSQDNYEWGVGEEADFITLLPIFNPDGTNWVIRDDVFGYQNWIGTPRRTTIITQTRISKRLLHAMHVENSAGRHMASEMFPQSVALHHGLKAVHAPHPIYSEQAWTPKRLDSWFNICDAQGSGGCQESPFGWGREHRFDSLSWYYRCDFPGKIYWNWLGWKAGEFPGGREWEETNDRLCLPPILLHPIKEVREDVDPASPLPY